MTPDPEWVNNSDVSKLEGFLDKLAAQLHSKRKEPTKTNLPQAMMLSVGIFVALFVALSVTLPNVSFSGNAFIGSSTQPSTEASRNGDAVQFSLIVASSGGIIPGLAYALTRDREVQQKNEELAALGLEMKYLRSKILTLKQAEAVTRLDQGVNSTDKDKGEPASTSLTGSSS